MQKVLRVFFYSGLFLLVISLGVYLEALSGLKELNEQAREEIGGLYLDTEYGTLSYTREGSVNSSAVILVHGFSTPKLFGTRSLRHSLLRVIRLLPLIISGAASLIVQPDLTMLNSTKVS